MKFWQNAFWITYSLNSPLSVCLHVQLAGNKRPHVKHQCYAILVLFADKKEGLPIYKATQQTHEINTKEAFELTKRPWDLESEIISMDRCDPMPCYHVLASIPSWEEGTTHTGVPPSHTRSQWRRRRLPAVVSEVEYYCVDYSADEEDDIDNSLQSQTRRILLRVWPILLNGHDRQ